MINGLQGLMYEQTAKQVNLWSLLSAERSEGCLRAAGVLYPATWGGAISRNETTISLENLLMRHFIVPTCDLCQQQGRGLPVPSLPSPTPVPSSLSMPPSCGTGTRGSLIHPSIPASGSILSLAAVRGTFSAPRSGSAAPALPEHQHRSSPW